MMLLLTLLVLTSTQAACRPGLHAISLAVFSSTAGTNELFHLLAVWLVFDCNLQAFIGDGDFRCSPRKMGVMRRAVMLLITHHGRKFD